MARMITSFNAKDAPKMDSFEPIPAGEYPTVIEESEMKPTKDGEGTYLQLKFKVLGGDFANRVLFERLNLQNKNPVTVEIAQKALASICEVCNVAVLEDSEQLHGIPIQVKVVVKPARAQYSAQNEIKGYKVPDGAASPPTNAPVAAGIPAAPAAPAAPTNAPPWKKA